MHVQESEKAQVTDVSNLVGGLHQHAVIDVDLGLHGQAGDQIFNVLGGHEIELLVRAHQPAIEQDMVHAAIAADKKDLAQAGLKQGENTEVLGAVLVAGIGQVG